MISKSYIKFLRQTRESFKKSKQTETCGERSPEQGEGRSRTIGEIPQGWEIKPAEEFCLRVTDGTHDSPQKQSAGKFLVTSRHLKKGHLDFDNAYFISEEDYIEANRRSKVDRWDVIFSMIGTIGEIYLEKNRDINYAIKNVGLFKSGDELKGKWLYYYFQSQQAKRYIHGSRAGTTQEYMTLESLRKFPIVSPSDIHEMRRIIGILDSIQEKIELNHQMNKTLESIAQAIFKRWFVDFKFPGYEKTKIVAGLPKGWRMLKIGEELITVLGGTPAREKSQYWDNGTIPWINSGKANEFRVIEPSELITKEGLDNSATKLMPEKTTIIAITGATLGQVSLLEISACANQSIVGVLPSDRIPTEFIYFWIKNNINRLISWQTGGAQQHINKNNVNDLELLCPSEQVMQKYIAISKPLFEQIRLNCFESRTLISVRDSLLPRLMSGKIKATNRLS